MKPTLEFDIQYIAVPDETYERIRKIADRNQHSVVEEIGMALEKHCLVEEKKNPISQNQSRKTLLG